MRSNNFSIDSRAARRPKRPGTIDWLACELIAEDINDCAVISEVTSRFPRAVFNEHHVAYYKSILRATEEIK